MKILIAGTDNTIEIYRDDPSLTMELAIIDPANSESLATPVVTDDATDVAIVAEITKGDYSFIAAGLAKDTKYLGVMVHSVSIMVLCFHAPTAFLPPQHLQVCQMHLVTVEPH